MYVKLLQNAQQALEQGQIFEATKNLSEAADLVQDLGPEYQRGIDAVASLHSRLERLIGEMDGVHGRLKEEVIPRWQQVEEQQKKPEPNHDRAMDEIAKLAMLLNEMGIPEVDEAGNMLSLDERLRLTVSTAAQAIKKAQTPAEVNEDETNATDGEDSPGPDLR